MRVFDVDWSAVIARLDAWNELPVHVRKVFARRSLDAKIPIKTIGKQRVERLIKVNFVKPDPSGKLVEVHADAGDLFGVIQGMARYHLAEASGTRRFLLYLQDVFTLPEQQALCPDDRLQGGVLQSLAEHLLETTWVKGFLEADDPLRWEADRLPKPASQSRFADRRVLDATRSLVLHLLEAGDWVPLSELPRRLSPIDVDALGSAIGAAIRYGLAFPAIKPDAMEPLIGLWPGVAARLNRTPATFPEGVSPEQVEERFDAAYLVDDMTAVIVAAAGDSLRLKTDQSLFARSREAIRSRLSPIPPWLEKAEWFRHDALERVDFTLSLLEAMKLIRTTGRPAKDFALAPSEAGRKWLALDPKEQIQQVITCFKRDTKEDFTWFRDLRLVPRSFRHSMRDDNEDRVLGWLAKVWTGIPDRTFVPLAAFIRWHAEMKNPLMRPEIRKTVTPLHYGLMPRTDESLEILWTTLLAEFLVTRLIPLGGVAVAHTGDGQIGIALTDVGRYLFGKVKDFEYGRAGRDEGQVLVQPNFDVTFLAASPVAEAAVSRLAERRGQRVGTIFRITRESIIQAASAGMTAEVALKTLRSVASQPLPENVAREIEGWFGQCRRVTMRKAVLLSCPDAETAARVASAGGNKARLVTEQIVEIPNQKAVNELLKKLRKAGVFVQPSDHDEPSEGYF